MDLYKRVTGEDLDLTNITADDDEDH